MNVSGTTFSLSVVLLLLHLQGIFVQSRQDGNANLSSLLSLSVQSSENHSQNEISDIFKSVEQGVLASDAKLFSQYFAKHVSINLDKRDNIYYSANQSVNILQNYFTSRKILSFKLSTIKSTDPSPYATGGGTLRYRSATKLFQVFVSITRDGDRWVISQFNVY